MFLFTYKIILDKCLNLARSYATCQPSLIVASCRHIANMIDGASKTSIDPTLICGGPCLLPMNSWPADCQNFLLKYAIITVMTYRKPQICLQQCLLLTMIAAFLEYN